LVYGRRFTTPILTPSNSRGLEKRLVFIFHIPAGRALLIDNIMTSGIPHFYMILPNTTIAHAPRG